jgi:hypothetical protein
MLSKDFIMLVGIAALISTPLAYFLMVDWLRGFEYAIKIDWWLFPVTMIGLVMIALFTIFWQAISTASANPVNSLKSE